MKLLKCRTVALGCLLLVVWWAPSSGQTVDPYEPNNSLHQATALSPPATITATVYPEMDADIFRWDAQAGSTVEVSLTDIDGSYLDAALWLYTGDGTMVAYNDDWQGSTRESRVRHVTQTSQTYYLRVAYYGNWPAGDSIPQRITSPVGGYRLTVRAYRWPSEHFSFTSRTGNNAVVGVPVSIQPATAGIPLEEGDEIAVFADGVVAPESLCVGATMWSQQGGTAITVWGDDEMTPQIDGARPGARLTFRIWKLRWDREYRIVDAAYQSGPATYEPNGISQLSRLEGRPHFEHRTRTGNNATIGIPAAIMPSVYGLPLEPGDEVGVFTDAPGFPDGLCVGSATWNDASTAITVWGDDSQTPEQDGALPGGRMAFRVWKNRWNREVSPVDALFEGPSTYAVNGIYQLLSLFRASYYTFQPNTGNNGTIGIPSTAVLLLGVSPLPGNFTLGVFNDDPAPTSLCVGAVTWTGASTAITIWGDDSQTPQIDGLQSGESFVFRVWDPANQQEYPYARAVFRQGVPIYSPNGIWILDSLIISTQTHVEDGGSLPTDYALEQNYPNPFNPETVIRYRVAEDGGMGTGNWGFGSEPESRLPSPESHVPRRVSLRIYDLLGRVVAVLVNEEQPAGTYTVTWNAARFPSGVYYYRLTAGQVTETKRMLLTR